MNSFAAGNDLWKKNCPNLKLYTGDEQHPEDVSHFGIKEMIEALVALDKAYGEAKASGDLPENTPLIYVNDISLPWGGLFKSYGKMEDTSHQSHKWGMDVDISYKNMTPQLRDWFEKTAETLFHKVEVHKWGKKGRHWHCDL